MSRVRNLLLVLSWVPLLSTGCFAFGRVRAGPAYSLSGEAQDSATSVGIDGIAPLPGLKWVDGKSDFPFGFHVSTDSMLSPRRTNVAWGTGLAYYGALKAVAGHVVVGSNLHVGRVDQRFSLGNFSPYVEVGVRAPVQAASVEDEEENRLFLSFDLAHQSYIDYLADEGMYTSFVILKFGLGWGH